MNERIISHYSRRASFELDYEGRRPFDLREALETGFNEARDRAKETHEAWANSILDDLGVWTSKLLCLAVRLNSGRDYTVTFKTETRIGSSDGSTTKVAPWPLATVQLRDRKLILRINERADIGIDPKFLYEVGERFGRRIEEDDRTFSHNLRLPRDEREELGMYF